MTASAARWLRQYLQHLLSDYYSDKFRLSHILAADFFLDENGAPHLIRVFGDVFDLAEPGGPRLILHRILHQSIVHLATRAVLDRMHMSLSEPLKGVREPFSLIEQLEIDPVVDLEPPFQASWTNYSVRVPYERQWMSIKVRPNIRTAAIYWENQQQSSE